MATKNKKPNKPAKPKPHRPTPEELENDPSLRWFPLKVGELLWSDDLQAYVRFNGYCGDAEERVRLSTEFGITPLPGEFNRLRVRRPRAGKGEGK